MVIFSSYVSLPKANFSIWWCWYEIRGKHLIDTMFTSLREVLIQQNRWSLCENMWKWGTLSTFDGYPLVIKQLAFWNIHHLSIALASAIPSEKNRRRVWGFPSWCHNDFPVPPATMQSTSCSCSSCKGHQQFLRNKVTRVLMVCLHGLGWYNSNVMVFMAYNRSCWIWAQKLGSWEIPQPISPTRNTWDLASFRVRVLQEPTSDTSTCAKSCLSGAAALRRMPKDESNTPNNHEGFHKWGYPKWMV